MFPVTEITPSVHVHQKEPTMHLQRALLRISFFNLFLVAVLGLLLRAYPLLNHVPLNYAFLLHGHSHFAFGGWIMPALIAMILYVFPEWRQKIRYHHWRNIVAGTLIAAYGMLLSFPVQGYGPVSISFSTLSVAMSYYLAVVLWKATASDRHLTSARFIRAGLVYLVLSSIGPFATGPLIALGKNGTPLYFNAIYFYLHFQYNGWFVFTVLGFIYQMLEQKRQPGVGKKVFRFFNAGCVPAYFLSTLWSHPPAIIYWIAGAGALVQLAGVVSLFRDLGSATLQRGWSRRIFLLAMAAFAIKSLLQLAGAFPVVADLAFLNRDLIIAYLHLVLLGFVTLSIFYFSMQKLALESSRLKAGLSLFLFAFVSTEILLITRPLGLLPQHLTSVLPVLLFWFTLLLPISAFMIFRKVSLASNAVTEKLVT
jgi:hypothetical protein